MRLPLQTLLTTTLLLLTSFTPASAICASGEIAIARKQIYQWSGQTNVLQSDSWVIAANDCHDIALSDHDFKSNPCAAGPGYGAGNGVNGCDGSGKPGFVWTSGGNFHDCYSVSGKSCATGPWLFEPVYWCCKRW